jgi:hypothetical protein
MTEEEFEGFFDEMMMLVLHEGREH